MRDDQKKVSQPQTQKVPTKEEIERTLYINSCGGKPAPKDRLPEKR